MSKEPLCSVDDVCFSLGIWMIIGCRVFLLTPSRDWRNLRYCKFFLSVYLWYLCVISVPFAWLIHLSTIAVQSVTSIVQRMPAYSWAPTTRRAAKRSPILQKNRLTQTYTLGLPCTSLILDIHTMINWHLSEQGIRLPVSCDHIAGLSL